jgi:hypothetical protein
VYFRLVLLNLTGVPNIYEKTFLIIDDHILNIQHFGVNVPWIPSIINTYQGISRNYSLVKYFHPKYQFNPLKIKNYVYGQSSMSV